MNEAVHLHAVTKAYGPVRAVNGVHLSVPAGQTVALLGPNGAGKSTTINLMLGLLAPDSGQVSLFGGTPEAAIRAGRIGVLPQDAKLIPRVTVAELVDFVRRSYPSPLPLAEVLGLAGLTDLAKRKADALSGGQARRVQFALAMAGDPELVVLDEPTTALDVEHRREFWTYLRAFAARGRTVLFSSHYLEEVAENADRVVVISNGRTIADATPDELRGRVGGRTVSLDPDGRRPDELQRLPGVLSVSLRGGRAYLSSADSDATVQALAQLGAIHDLEVTGAGLEEAFMALTASDRTAV
ncbi:MULTISPECIES: ABC transporter ATP-binding protein [unclassified Crossiella]|uniref:ABC transporter ATP-binding protein n=1 Tax=unclassified Crossiella TaxID=2620835 RepID=UPI001FFFD482|nr:MULTISPECIES: ABC transporter ATP-binding protein [unclassified Crossiella]MCK2244277.1 ABC transporter ATP-binding protein [Crossiella sp. S99.2]MCK2257895.1 ABC transporter ATP-binding protein [Crossiella sp. S99.1]